MYVELAHPRLGDREEISKTRLIIIMESELSTFPIVVIVFRGFVYELAVPSYDVGFTYIPGKLGFASLITIQPYNERK